LHAGDEDTIRLITAGLMVDTDVETFVVRDQRCRVVDVYGSGGLFLGVAGKC